MSKSTNSKINDVVKYARSLDYEEGHSQQVKKLALNLFDELRALHKMDNEVRFLLESAALLHDIGWINGQKGHHKSSMKLILAGEELPYDDDERIIVASVARYHRKALPKPEHQLYCDMSPKQQNMVEILAGILRIADGLDRSHYCVIKGVKCDIDDKEIRIKCRTESDAYYELLAAIKKAELLKKATKRDVVFEIM